MDIAEQQACTTGSGEQGAGNPEAHPSSWERLKARFDALSYHDQKKILEEHADINTHYEWWEYEYEWFVERMDDKGITAENISFSGFCSQGDGASFEGRVSDWPKFLAAHNLTDQCSSVRFLLERGLMYLHFTVSRSRYPNYVHANMMGGDLEWAFYDIDESADPLQLVALLSAKRSAERELEGAEKQFIGLLRGHANDLYRRLEQEYEYQTSEEAILTSLYENELLEEALTKLENQDDTHED